MIAKKSRWSDPAIIVAALAVLNGGYWQYRAFGAADDKATAEIARRVERIETILATRTPIDDQQIAEINERLRRIEDRRR